MDHTPIPWGAPPAARPPSPTADDGPRRWASLAGATALVALAATLVLLLAGCGGGAAAPEATPDAPEAGTPGLRSARAGDLAAWAQRTLAAQAAAATLPPPAAPAPPGGASDPAVSRTRVQEPGIDEPDLIKTDGRRIATQVPEGWELAAVQLHGRAEDGSLAEGARWTPAEPDLSTGAWRPRGLLLADDAQSLVALQEHQSIGGAWPMPVPAEACAGCARALTVPPPGPVQLTTLVQQLEMPDLATLRPAARHRVDGELVGARRIGDTLVLVVQHRPTLPLPSDPAARAAAIAAITDGQLLPRRWLGDGRSEPAVGAGECWLQPGNGATSLELTLVMLIDLRSPTLAAHSRCFVGGTETVYLSPQNLWLATTRWQGTGDRETDIHQFAIDAAAQTLAYRGSATVAGDLGWVSEHRSSRLSEHEGHLRVLSFTGRWDGSAAVSPARLTLLRVREPSQPGGALQTVSTLPNARRPAAIGKPGEQLFGVGFDGARGYAVTYRRIDPLYVLDLSDPADPRIAGELELPGFSEVLQPLPGGLLLGVGQDEAEGVALVLFDVADAAAPRVLSRHTAGGRFASHGLSGSRHAMALRLDGDQGRIALPLRTVEPDLWRLHRGLLTMELDLAARQLRPQGLLNLLPEAEGDAMVGLDQDRAALIGPDVYHLRAGRLSRHGW